MFYLEKDLETAAKSRSKEAGESLARKAINHVQSMIGDAGYKVVLEKINLLVRKVRFSPDVIMGHEKALENNAAKYYLNRVLCKVYSVPQGRIYVDGQPKPHAPLELNFDKNNYIKGYRSLFSLTEK
ncbi:uncharacterized protein F54H12.2 [Caerostris extrusa]|uniref:Uncharacterized protein F54H12.2 n=1 Tax=Caerostris extrusa TaxID=172846 RepID=A0AAV4MSA7_CAEEX|nr:uncharacterized protein F54H12.2 [Caerostris extrusa]